MIDIWKIWLMHRDPPLHPIYLAINRLTANGAGQAPDLGTAMHNLSRQAERRQGV